MGTGDLARWIDMGLTGLFVLTGAVMTFFILLQEGKGGGLTALGGTKAAGVEGVTNPIRRATVYMAIVFFTLAVILGVIHRPRESIKIGAAPATTTTSNPITFDDAKTAAPPAKKPEEGTKPAEAKTVETKTVEVKTPEANKDESKKDEAKKDESKKEESKKDETKKDETKKDEAKKDEPKKADEPKKDEAKKAD